jgi:RNA polymerase sigma-70 factor (ECF subfamily)
MTHSAPTGQVEDVTISSATASASREARFRAAYEATHDDLLRFVQRRVDPSHAEDVTAEVFLVAWRRLDDLPKELDDARPWLFGVARATMLNHHRGVRRRDALAVRLAEATPMNGSSPTDDDAVSRFDLAAAWARLSAAEQEVLSLAVWEDLDSARAGTVLGCSATAYRLRLSRARRSLSRHLEAASPPDRVPRATITTPKGSAR